MSDIINDSKRIHWAQSTILQMLDFWANAQKLKKWLGYQNLKQLYGSLTPQSNAYEIRKTICEYSENKNVLFINWIHNNNYQQNKSEQIHLPHEIKLILNFFEDNKLALYAINLNTELCRLVFMHRKYEHYSQKSISPYQSLKKSDEKESLRKIDEKDSQFKISRNEDFRDDMKKSMITPMKTSVDTCLDKDSLVKIHSIKNETELKQINNVIKDFTFVQNFDSVQNKNCNKILVCPDPLNKTNIEGINDEDVCDSNLILEKKLVENLFDPYALGLAKRQKEWIQNFISDNHRPKGNLVAKFKVIYQFRQKISGLSRSKPSEIMCIDFEQILDEIERLGMGSDVTCMNFPESIELIKKCLNVSILRQEENLDNEFEQKIKFYGEKKEFLTKKKQRITDAVNTLMVAAGASEELNEEYERRFLDEVFEQKIHKDIPQYIHLMKKFKTLMIGYEAKSDLRLLLKQAKQEIIEDDLKTLLGVKKTGNEGDFCAKLTKESQTKEILATPYKSNPRINVKRSSYDNHEKMYSAQKVTREPQSITKESALYNNTSQFNDSGAYLDKRSSTQLFADANSNNGTKNDQSNILNELFMICAGNENAGAPNFDDPSYSVQKKIKLEYGRICTESCKKLENWQQGYCDIENLDEEFLRVRSNSQ